MNAKHFNATPACWVCLAVLAAVSPARAADYARLLAKAEAAHACAAKSGRKLAPPEQPATPHRPTEEEKRRGLVVYLPPIERPFADRRPAAAEVRAAADVRAAPGETESFLLALHALKARRGLTWCTAGPMPTGIRVEILPVVMAPLAPRRSKEYRVQGMWLAGPAAVDVEAGHSRAWVVRIRVAEGAKPGSYKFTPSLATKAGPLLRIGPAIRIRVLPLKLADPWRRKYVFGAFCGGADFSQAQYAEMKAHGIESILWFWGHYGLDVRNEGGKLRMDFTALDATIRRFQKAGLRGPIALALGNDCCGHFERAICQAFNLPMQPRVKRQGKVVQLAVLDNPKIEKLMVQALRQLFDHAKAAKWPEIVILPYDEPTERLMKEHRRMVRLFRTHLPAVRLYGVTMNRLSWAKMLLDTDVLVANGDFARIRALATASGKSAWFYGSSATAHGYAGCRWRFGLQRYAHGADGSWFWCYNFYVGDPWNEFDGFTPDSSWVICWPPLTKGAASVETLAYEGLREAVDDVRYAMTLEAALARAGASPKAQSVAAAYKKWRAELRGANPTPVQIAGYRDRIVQWILALRANER